MEDKKKLDVDLPENQKFKLKAAVFLTSVAGASALFGFGTTLALARRKDPKYFAKGMEMPPQVAEAGSELALRALGWGTAFALSGVSIFCFAVWKVLGVRNLTEFRQKVGSILPVIPKKGVQGRNEFSGLRDLFQHIVDEDKKNLTKKDN